MLNCQIRKKIEILYNSNSVKQKKQWVNDIDSLIYIITSLSMFCEK